MKVSLTEMYVQGVSTRKVNAVLSELYGFEVTISELSRAIKELDEQLESWRNRELGQYVYLILDSSYEKVRVGGCVQDAAILINLEGRREVLGVSVAMSEAELHWRAFFKAYVRENFMG